MSGDDTFDCIKGYGGMADVGIIGHVIEAHDTARAAYARAAYARAVEHAVRD